jgi:hypothetical protein
LQAREERSQIIKRVLVEGTDFGVIPGTKQNTLLKPGAEKIADSLNLYPDYERIGCVEDWDKPLFHYTYRCILRARGSDGTVATGIGSCNSMESRYRWRNSARVCPQCGQETIIKGKEEYGGGFLCFAKKGGCGAKFGERDAAIVGQKVGQIANDDVFSLVNTIDKMAQKRAMVAASLNLGFSDHFTQDVEDNPESFGVRAPSEERENPAPVRVDPPRKEWPAKGVPPPSASHSDGAPVWRGKFLKMETKNGKKPNGDPWTLYKFIGSDGEAFGTFSESLAQGLGALDGKFVEVVYEVKKNGNNIVEYRDVNAEEAPFS